MAIVSSEITHYSNQTHGPSRARFKFVLSDSREFLRGPVNVPSNARYSIAAISYSHNISQKEVSEKTVQNAVKFFNLKIV